MTWFSAGAAVVGTAASLYSASTSASNSAKQASAASNAENDAIAKQNMSQIVRNSYRTGMANLQLGLQKKQMAKAGLELSSNEAAVLAQADTLKAASGSIGASADTARNDIQMKADAARTNLKDEYEVMLENYNNELEANRMNALNSVVDAKKYTYNGPSGGEMLTSALVGGVVSFAGNYAARSMKLGLGAQNNVSSGLGSSSSFSDASSMWD